MKRTFVLLTFAIVSLIVNAQQYPAEWVDYTHSGYLSDIQGDSNSKDLPEIDFKNYLLNVALTNLAKHIQVRVHDVANLAKLSKDGRTSITYSANTQFSTDVNFQLVETKTVYDSSSKYGYAIAYINKAKACQYYKKEIEVILNNIDNAVTIARNYIDTGFRERAKTELQQTSYQFAKIDKPMTWLNICDMPSHENSMLQDRINRLNQTVKQMIADLQYGATIYLLCDADLFGKKYLTFSSAIKGQLSRNGFSFSEDIDSADFIIKITAVSTEGTNVSIGQVSAYFTYVDAIISVTKRVTSQVIYEDKYSVKGSHTQNFEEAAKMAYREIEKNIAPAIKSTIKQ